MKTFTVIALCKCGCKEINAWHILASDSRQARKKYKSREDPMWPMKILAVTPGKFHINQMLKGIT